MPRPGLRRAPARAGLPVAAAVAALSGLAAAAAFPRLGIWPLAIVSVAGLSWAVQGRRVRTGAWLGLIYGAAFFGPLLHWTGEYVGAAPWLILAAAEALFMALLGAALPLVQRLPGAPVWIACCWVLEEALRDRLPFGGFPWGRLAFSQDASPLRWFIQFGGAPLLSFAVALAGGALCTAALAVGAAHPARRLVAGCSVIVLLLAGGALAGHFTPTGAGDRRLQVALVQGSVPDRGLDSFDRARQVLDNHVAQTYKLAAEIRSGAVPRPDLVLWPENASDVDPFADPAAGREIQRVVDAVGAPTLVGAILAGPGPTHRRNAGILWFPRTGPGAEYIKRHPVPFAEYMPLRSIADRVSSAARLVTQDMVAGHGNGLLRGGPVPIGDVICFEVAYDGLVRSSVAAGARLLVVQTNNATFGHTSETYQQLAMSRLRAIENGRTVLQVSTTGVSAVIEPNGTVSARADDLFHPAILSADVPLRTALTPATRLGAAPEWFLTGLAVLAVAAGAVLRRRRPTDTPSPEATTPTEMVTL